MRIVHLYAKGVYKRNDDEKSENKDDYAGLTLVSPVHQMEIGFQCAAHRENKFNTENIQDVAEKKL